MARMALIATPASRAGFRRQAEELFAQVGCIMKRQTLPLQCTTMMVFLKNAKDEVECREIINTSFGAAAPVITCVVQPPCCGAALGVELWTVGGAGVTVKRWGNHVVAVEADGIRWIHCAGITSGESSTEAFGESMDAFKSMQRNLALAGVGFERVVRTWLYVNQITALEPSSNQQRYQELNRARTEFFNGIPFAGRMPAGNTGGKIYPASTGIGTSGARMVMCCMALQSDRSDVFVQPLENPRQTPAYDYQGMYSPKSPKFSRAMAVVQGHFVSTLVSGTASILNSITCHPDDIVGQTRQTIDNIENLISAENFSRHGLGNSGATLKDIAKLRVYVKRPQDYERCRRICEERLPGVPSIYLQADVCRQDLLMEMEAVAFSPFNRKTAEI